MARLWLAGRMSLASRLLVTPATSAAISASLLSGKAPVA